MATLNGWAAEVRAGRERGEKFAGLPVGTRVKFENAGTDNRSGSGEIVSLPDPERNRMLDRNPHAYGVMVQTRPGSGVMVGVGVCPWEIVKVTRKAVAG